VNDRVLEVALPLPVQTLFTYRLPDGWETPARGERVLVPFGSRRLIGVVAEAGRAGSRTGLKPALERLDDAPLVEAPLLDLAEWVADHYLAPPGECFRLVLPPAGVRGSRAVARLAASPAADESDGVLAALREGPLRVSTLASRLGRDPRPRLAQLRHAGRVVVEQAIETYGHRHVRVAAQADPTVAARGSAQAEVLKRLQAAGGKLVVAELVRDRPSLRGALARLTKAGAVRIEERRIERSPELLPGVAAPARNPSVEQSRALESVLEAVAARSFSPFLLHGVTASGKTEIYFRAAERALELGRGCIILVPEIALTPLLVRAAVGRFGDTVSVLHSELSMGERHDQWWRIRDAQARVVIGARSAVFSPVPDLGLVVVDEEHAATYKQEESPRYHGRDVAVVRAQREGATVILGSATPSVESYSNALGGKYTRLVLSERIGASALPQVTIVDRRAALRSGDDPILTTALREALEQRLDRGEQTLLLLNRRGYATSLLCRECAAPAVCRNCSVSLTLHRLGQIAECHYCGFQSPAPRACAGCGGEYLKLTGYGTERVVESVEAAFPKARIARLDRDLARRRGALAKVLTGFEAGEIDILVGTQMIAKGHDFPRVTLVGVVDADVGLGLPDFRSAERTFQLLTQVAGRAGRGELAGEVILQSHIPDHYALGLACAQDYRAFFDRELEFRSTMSYPPAAALVNLVLRRRDAGEGAREAAGLARRLRQLAGRRFRVLGPALAPLQRLRQEHRFQILLKGSRKAMREAVRTALVERFGEVRWPGTSVDVDPVSVM